MLTHFPSHMKELKNAFWNQSRASELLWLQVFPLCWRGCKQYCVSYIQRFYGPQLKECLGLGTA